MSPAVSSPAPVSPAVAAPRHVVRQPGGDEARETGHAGMLPDCGPNPIVETAKSGTVRLVQDHGLLRSGPWRVGFELDGREVFERRVQALEQFSKIAPRLKAPEAKTETDAA